MRAQHPEEIFAFELNVSRHEWPGSALKNSAKGEEYKSLHILRRNIFV